MHLVSTSQFTNVNRTVRMGSLLILHKFCFTEAPAENSELGNEIQKKNEPHCWKYIETYKFLTE